MRQPPEWKQRVNGRPEKALLREAFTGWLPEDLLWRGKEQFGDGSGAGTVLAELAATHVAAADTETVPDTPTDSWALRSDEEVMYHGIWERHFAGVRPLETLERFATA